MPIAACSIPVAPKIRLKLYFAGYANPVVYQAPQKAYVNTTPGGQLPVPRQGRRISPTVEWAGSHGTHQFTREQKFAYDLGVSRWNGKQWTELTSTATKPIKNTDFLIYGKPVYTMAAGTIVNCAWSAPDNTVGIEGPKQNHFWILHGTGEIALYAPSPRPDRLSKKYCPETVSENTFSLNIPIAAGVKIGNVGNSGSSDKPHLHVHVQRAVNGKKISSTGRPLLFRDSSNAGADAMAIGADPFSLNPLIGQMPGAPTNLIAP